MSYLESRWLDTDIHVDIASDFCLPLDVLVIVLEPALAPDTCSTEPDTARNMICILKGVETLQVLGSGVPEVNACMSGASERRHFRMAWVVHEMLTSIGEKRHDEDSQEEARQPWRV